MFSYPLEIRRSIYDRITEHDIVEGVEEPGAVPE